MDAQTLLAQTVPIVTLQQFGDPSAAACEGEFCVIPDHHEQAVINRKLDENAV